MGFDRSVKVRTGLGGKRPIRARGASSLGRSVEREELLEPCATDSKRSGERLIRVRGANSLARSAEREELVDLSGVEPLTSTLPV